MTAKETTGLSVQPTGLNSGRGKRDLRLLVVGLGNILSHLYLFLPRKVAFMRLVDRDKVERRNTGNQSYDLESVGESKVAAVARRIDQLAPHIELDLRQADLEDLPWGDFADVDFVLAGLDSLVARQALAQKLYPLDVPYIDGAVGDSTLVRVQVFVPRQACLECNWGSAHYRQLMAETPCQPGATAATPRTMAPACAGAATASFMVAQLDRFLGDDPPQESYEINGDLSAGRFVASRRRLNRRCRASHQVDPASIELGKPFSRATVGDLLEAIRRESDEQDLWLEFRRGILEPDLFGARRFVSLGQLDSLQERRLPDFGLTSKDRVIVRSRHFSEPVHLCLGPIS